MVLKVWVAKVGMVEKVAWEAWEEWAGSPEQTQLSRLNSEMLDA